MKKAGSRLIKAAREVRDIAAGIVAAKLHVPADTDIKAIRIHLGMSQDEFAAEFGISTSQIRDWEQNRLPPAGNDSSFLTLTGRDPEKFRKLLQALQTETNDDTGLQQDKLAV